MGGSLHVRKRFTKTQKDVLENIGGGEGMPRSVRPDGYHLLYAGIFSAIVLTGAGRLIGIAELTATHMLAAAAVLALCAGIQCLTVKGRLVCSLLAAVFLGVVIAAFGVRQCGLFLRSFLWWLSGGNDWTAEWRLWYELLTAAFIILLCYGLQFFLARHLVIKALTADVLVSLLLFCLLTEWEISHTGVTLALCYLVMVYAEWIQREWKKVREGDRKRYMLWLMPFVALYFVLLLCMPAPEKPYEWQFVRDTYSHLSASFIGLTQRFMGDGGDDFDTTLSGFSEDGALQEAVQENDMEIMTILGADSLVTNVYLTGRIYDTFDGNGWLQTYHETDDGERSTFWDARQTQEAARAYEAAYLRDYLAVTHLQIRYRYFRTASLFVPLKTRSIEMPREQEFYFLDGDNLLFREKRGYGTVYDVEYYQINAGADSFDRFLRAAARIGTSPTGAADTVSEDGAVAGRDAVGIDAARQQRVYEVYTEDVALSDRTRQYLEELTADAQDPLEKLRRMEGMLSSFTYTKQPGKLPEGIEDGGDFLDFFLLEGREGYCMHFATAFVLLARAQGMPARYVQGFCVPIHDQGEISVYGDMAHAWPEVYFDGAGWIPFEPTPGYGQIRYTPWETEEGDGSIAASYGQPSQVTDGEAAVAIVSGEDVTAAEAEKEAGPGVERLLTVLWYAVLAVCLAGGIILALQRIVRCAHYRRLDVTGKFRMEIAANLRVLGFLGLRRKEGETLQEFRERAVQAEILRAYGRRCDLQCITDYEEILYGEKAARQESLEIAVREQKELLAVLRERKKWRYFLFWLRMTL